MSYNYNTLADVSSNKTSLSERLDFVFMNILTKTKPALHNSFLSYPNLILVLTGTLLGPNSNSKTGKVCWMRHEHSI